MTSRTHAIRTLKLQPHIWKDKFEGNYCPIIIVEEDAKREYKSRVLAQEIYSSLHYTIPKCTMGYYIMQGMYDMV
jgi:hypothetical protein